MARRALTSVSTPLVSTLPVSPVEGQIATYQNAAMASLGIVWTFRYNSAGGTWPWQFVGGPLWSAGPLGSLTGQTGAAATALPSGPTIVVPRTGIYTLHFGGETQQMVNGLWQGNISWAANGGWQPPAAWLVGYNAFNGGSVSSTRGISVNAGETLSIMVFVGNGISTDFRNGFLSLLPQRVT